jgi:glucose/arabinose dehydrogenase
MFRTTLLIVSLLMLIAFSCGNNWSSKKKAKITLPKGFKAVLVADNLGSCRHLAVNSNGDIYVKLEKLKDGKGMLRLRDTDGNGTADDIFSFDEYPGTGVAISNGYLYASSNSSVYRYKFNSKNEVGADSEAEVIVKDLVDKRQHASKSITLDGAGNIYVNIGAPSNACQEQDRTQGSKGQDPCPILETAGGIWKFKTDAKDQSYKEGTRYATGLRNVVGLDWNTAVNSLFVTQHGRDQLNGMYPDLYNDKENAEIPAEEFFAVKQGDDFGWPYCYYDYIQKKKILGPEYGGDKMQQGRCATVGQPVYAFPAHWGPNALLFYTGKQFPAKYMNGAFIAFHGSWNRASEKQGGYNVVFLPMKNGRPTGEYEVFADGFAGKKMTPADAVYRPTGLAMGPDGALYISDDQRGAIWKIVYKGE